MMFYCFQKNNLIVTIELLGSMLDNAHGFVNSVKNNIICIRKVDSFGNNDGNAIIQFEDITHIFCDTDDEMTLKILNSLYNK